MTHKTLDIWLLALLVTGALSLGTIVIDGDVYIQLMTSVYKDTYENDTCYNVDSESVQNMEAIRWILNKLNANDYFSWNGKGVGLRVSPTCGSKVKAEKVAYELSNELDILKPELVGVLGPEFSSEAESVSRLLSAFPDEYRLLQVAYAATSASLRNRDIYNNFFRTIPPDDLQARVMTEFAQALNWTYMAIIYDDDAYGRGGKDALINDITSRNICFPVLIPVPDAINYDLKYLESQIRDSVINASVPVGGAIVFGSYTLGSTVLTATKNVLLDFPNVTRPQFLFSEAGGYLEGREDAISKGIFVLSPPKKIVQEFQTHWRSLFTSVENIYNLPKDYRKWMMDVYKERFGCELPAIKADNNCPVVSETEVIEKIPPSVYNQYAIQASLIMAKVTKAMHDTKCPSSDRCDDFFRANRQDYIDVAKNVVVDFDNDFESIRIQEFKNPDLIISFSSEGEAEFPDGFPLYEIYNHQECAGVKMCLVKDVLYKFEISKLLDDLRRDRAVAVTSTGLNVFENEIKDYDSDDNELIWPDIRKPQCPDTHVCDSCLSRATTDTSIFYQPGDLYIVGIVPVHNPGATPLQCGSIKNGAIDVVEVIRFAVSDARNSYADKIPEGKIGIIIIDSCNDPHIIQEKVLTLHRLGVFKDGVYIPVADNIIGYIGGWSSSVSTVTADITSRMGYVQISYASTATSLSDTLEYPYFMRTPTPDNYQADTMLQIVNTLNANLIQIVHSDGTYGMGGRDTLMSLVDDYSLCVAEVHTIYRNTDSANLVRSLRKFASARIVLLFISSFDADTIIKSMNNLLKPGEFIFIASEGWGTRLDLTGYRNLIGSITLTSELHVNEKFKDQLKDLIPDGSNSNPWIREYMENEFQCYYQWSYDKKSGNPCSGEEKLDVFSTDYRIDAWSSFAERAVLALLLGAKPALDNKCGGSTAVCDAFRTNPGTLFNLSKVLEFTDENGVVTTRAFNDKGDGTAGYKIYAVGTNGRYTKVGSSDLNGETAEVNFQKGQYPGPSDVNSSCSSQAVCAECFPAPSVADKKDSLSVGLIVVIVILAIICCVLAGILLFVCNRLGCCFRLENGRPKLNENYITPVYLQRRPDGNNAIPPYLEHQENYDSIDDMYRHRRSAAAGSDSSYNRRPPIGGRDDSGMGSESKVATDVHPSGGSYFSTGSSKSGSGPSNNSRESYMHPTPPPHAQRGSGGNVQLNHGGSMQKVVYQQDGSYVTAPDQENRGFEPDQESRDVSDQSTRFPSTDSDKSLGYLRSVHTVQM